MRRSQRCSRSGCARRRACRSRGERLGARTRRGPRRERRRRSAVSVCAAQGRGGRAAPAPWRTKWNRLDQPPPLQHLRALREGRRACSRTSSPASRAVSRPMSPRGPGARLQRRRRHRRGLRAGSPCAGEARAERSTTSAPAGRRRCAPTRSRSQRSPEIRCSFASAPARTPDQDLPSLVADPARAQRSRLAARALARGAAAGCHRVVARLPSAACGARTTKRGAASMTTCRTHKSDRLYLFLPLGDHPLANGFLREDSSASRKPLPARRPRLPRLRADPGR